MRRIRINSIVLQSKQSTVTLLHFIVRSYMKSRGGALSSACVLPVPEPGDVLRAAAIDFADVAASLAMLRTKLDGEPLALFLAMFVINRSKMAVPHKMKDDIFFTTPSIYGSIKELIKGYYNYVTNFKSKMATTTKYGGRIFLHFQFIQVFFMQIGLRLTSADGKQYSNLGWSMLA